MINSVTLVGRITKDLSLQHTGSGIPFCRLTLAVNRPFSSQQGERQADFINLVVWRKLAENLVQYMSKGSLIGVKGRIQTGSFDGRDGTRVYTTDVVCDEVSFLESKKTNNTNYQSSGYTNPGNYGFPDSSSHSSSDPYQQRLDEDPFSNDRGPSQVSEDDLPF